MIGLPVAVFLHNRFSGSGPLSFLFFFSRSEKGIADLTLPGLSRGGDDALSAGAAATARLSPQRRASSSPRGTAYISLTSLGNASAPCPRASGAFSSRGVVS